MPRTNFAERLRVARARSQHTMRSLADECNCTPQAVKKWEHGEGMPDSRRFIALCAVLDVSAEWLFAPEPLDFHSSETAPHRGGETVNGPVLNLADWIERRKIGPYADYIIHSVRAYEDEIERLRAALDRIQTPKAFYVPTSKVDPEAFARMIYAQSILNGVNLEKAELIAEHKTRERYRPIEGER